MTTLTITAYILTGMAIGTFITIIIVAILMKEFPICHKLTRTEAEKALNNILTMYKEDDPRREKALKNLEEFIDGHIII